MILFTIAAVCQAQELELKLDTSGFGSIISLINNSNLNSGTITFEKSTSGRTTTTIYRYEDNLTSIEVRSNVDAQNIESNSEHVFLDTRSPDIQLFNIRVGAPMSDVIRQLGQPMQREGTALIYTTTGYFLIFHITNNRVSRIIYNPYS
jgi:hypothetical protein